MGRRGPARYATAPAHYALGGQHCFRGPGQRSSSSSSSSSSKRSGSGGPPPGGSAAPPAPRAPSTRGPAHPRRQAAPLHQPAAAGSWIARRRQRPARCSAPAGAGAAIPPPAAAPAAAAAARPPAAVGGTGGWGQRGGWMSSCSTATQHLRLPQSARVDWIMHDSWICGAKRIRSCSSRATRHARPPSYPHRHTHTHRHAQTNTHHTRPRSPPPKPTCCCSMSASALGAASCRACSSCRPRASSSSPTCPGRGPHPQDPGCRAWQEQREQPPGLHAAGCARSKRPACPLRGRGTAPLLAALPGVATEVATVRAVHPKPARQWSSMMCSATRQRQPLTRAAALSRRRCAAASRSCPADRRLTSARSSCTS
jgi:hypothetical protein